MLQVATTTPQALPPVGAEALLRTVVAERNPIRVPPAFNAQEGQLATRQPQQAPQQQAPAFQKTLSNFYQSLTSPQWTGGNPAGGSTSFLAQLYAQQGAGDVSRDAYYRGQGANVALSTASATAIRSTDPQVMRRELLSFNAPPYDPPRDEAPNPQSTIRSPNEGGQRPATPFVVAAEAYTAGADIPPSVSVIL